MAPFEKKQTAPSKLILHPSNMGFLPGDLNDLDPADFPDWEFHKERGPMNVVPKGNLSEEGFLNKDDKYSIFQDFGPGDPIEYGVGTVGKEPGYSKKRKEIKSTVPVTLFSMDIKNPKGAYSTEFLEADELRKIEEFTSKIKEKKAKLYEKRKEEELDLGRFAAMAQPKIQGLAKAEERRWLEEHDPVVLNAIDEIDKSTKRIEELEKDMMYLSIPAVEDYYGVPYPTLVDDVWDKLKIWDYKLAHPENQDAGEYVDNPYQGRGFIFPELDVDSRNLGKNLIRPRDLVDLQKGDPGDGAFFGLIPSRLNFPISKEWYSQKGNIIRNTVRKGGEDAYRMIFSVAGSIIPYGVNYKALKKLRKLEREYRFRPKEFKELELPKNLKGPSFLGKKMSLGAWTNTQMIMGGIAGGAGAGPLHYEALDEAMRNKLEIGPKPLGEKSDYERYRDYVFEEVIFESLGQVLGVSGGFLARRWENLFMKDKKKKLELMEFARITNTPLPLAVVSDRGPVKQFVPNVFGKFPFVDTKFKSAIAGGNVGFWGFGKKKLTEGVYPAIQRGIQTNINTLAPRVSLESLSNKIHKSAMTSYDNNVKLAGAAYSQASLAASKLPKHFRNFVPTTNVKNYVKNLKKGVLEDVLKTKREAYRFGEYDKLSIAELSQIPGLSLEQKDVFKYLQRLDELPSHISIGQLKELDDELWQVYAKYGKDLGLSKKALTESKMKWSNLKKAFEMDRLTVSRQSRNLSGMNAEKLKKDGYKLQKIVGEGDAEKWIDADPKDVTAVWHNPDTGLIINPSYIERFFKKQIEGAPNLTKEALEDAKQNIYDAVDSLSTGDLWYGKYVEGIADLGAGKMFRAIDDNIFTFMQGEMRGKAKMGPDMLLNNIHKTMFNPNVSGGADFFSDLIKTLPRGPEGKKLLRHILRSKVDDALAVSYQTAGGTSGKGAQWATLHGEPIKVFDLSRFDAEMGFDISQRIWEDPYRLFKEALLVSQKGGGKKLNKESLKLLEGMKGYREILKLVNTMPLPESSVFAARGAVFAVGAGGAFGGYFGGTEGIPTGMLLGVAAMRFGASIITNPQFTDTVMSAVSNGPNYFTKYGSRQAFGEAYRTMTQEAGLWDQTIDAHIDEIINSEGYNPQALEALAQALYLKESSPEAGLKGPQNKITNTSEVLAYLDKEIINKDKNKTLQEKVSEELSARYPGRKIQEIDLIPPSGRTPQRTVMEGDREYISPSPFDKPQTRPTVMGQSTLPANMYGSMFPGDTLGAGIAQQQQTAQGPQQRTSLMASGGIALATPAAQLSGKVLENQAARNIMSTFWGTPMQQTVQNMLLTGTAKERDPRPEGQVKLSTLYDPQGKWIGKGPEPTGVSAPEGKEAWFTPEKERAVYSSIDPLTGAWRGPRGMDPRGFMRPTIHRPGSIQGATMYTPPGKIHYEDIDPVYSSASAITQQDPSRYRVAGFNQGGILSTKKAKQMVA